MATLTTNVTDAGSSAPSTLYVTVNIDGIDVVSHHVVYLPPFEIKQGHAGVLPVADTTVSPISFDSDLLTNSSVRVSITGDDAWKPQHLLLIGRNIRSNLAIPLAGELDNPTWLSTDSGDASSFTAVPTIPLRLVGRGDDSTLIQGVLLLLVTSNEDDAGTDSLIELEIKVGQNVVFQRSYPLGGGDTPQDDLEQNAHNWYFQTPQVPFTRGDVRSNGEIKLRILGDDAWLPRQVFVYGFDTIGFPRPTAIVPLASIPNWDMGWMSTVGSEGSTSVFLPLSSEF